ncbi:hypothetical protein GLE_3602 [Lysobacter enzymogenes]|uniref:Uncharacterized protein n=1 Tax=Lysobacter enzymogenes TaxID=69 RepID=A0A0S2DKB5_LYSEN|nr:hypothetical protein GLE_3602 [Lysobacter enzymogenes]
MRIPLRRTPPAPIRPSRRAASAKPFARRGRAGAPAARAARPGAARKRLANPGLVRAVASGRGRSRFCKSADCRALNGSATLPRLLSRQPFASGCVWFIAIGSGLCGVTLALQISRSAGWPTKGSTILSTRADVGSSPPPPRWSGRSEPVLWQCLSSSPGIPAPARSSPARR